MLVVVPIDRGDVNDENPKLNHLRGNRDAPPDIPGFMGLSLYGSVLYNPD
jgi:hypothetical protein